MVTHCIAMLHYSLLQKPVGFKSKHNAKEIVKGTLTTYKAFDANKFSHVNNSTQTDKQPRNTKTKWTFEIDSLSENQNEQSTGPVKYGLLKIKNDNYAALVAQVEYLSGINKQYVIAERFDSRPWQSMHHTLYPDWENIHEKLKLEKRGWPPNTRHPLIKNNFNWDGSYPPPKCLNKIAKGHVVTLRDSSKVQCKKGMMQMFRMLKDDPGIDVVFSGLVLPPLLNCFSVPKHVEELCAFLLISPQYLRILSCFKDVCNELIEQFNREEKQDGEKDAVFLASTVLKIIEDGYCHWLFKHDNTALKYKNQQFISTDKLETIGADIFQLLDLMYEAVESKHYLLQEEKLALEADQFNIHALCLQWLACRYKDQLQQSGFSKRIPEKTHLFSLLRDEAFIIGKSCRSLFEKCDTLPLVDDMLVLSDSDVTSSYLGAKHSSQNCCTARCCDLFKNALHKLQPQDLLIFGEVGVLYDIDNFPLHGILACLTFLHETRGLPFSFLRNLCFISSLARDYIPSFGKNFNLLEVHQMPKHLFSGDQPISNLAMRPSALWWTQFAKDIATTREISIDLRRVLFVYPQYARMRVAAYWKPGHDNFPSSSFDVSLATWEVQTFSTFLKSEFDEVFEIVAEKKRQLDCCVNSLVAAHAYFSSGGPCKSFSPKLVANARLNQDLLAFMKFSPVGPTCENEEDIQVAATHFKNLQKVVSSLNECNPLQPFISVKEWLTLANIGMIFREMNVVGMPRGLCSFSVASHHGYQQQNFLSKWLTGVVLKKSQLKYSPVETFTWHQLPNELTYHLFRHDVRPVAPSYLRRKFFSCDSDNGIAFGNPEEHFSVMHQLNFDSD